MSVALVEIDGWVTVWPPIREHLAEEWRPITEAPNYAVSTMGRVRNAAGKILKPWTHESGHLYVGLGSKCRRQVHRLVLFTFVGPPPSDKHEALHGNGIPWDNRLTNLSWGTRLENIFDNVRHAGKLPRASLSPQQADAIRAELEGTRRTRGARAAAAERHGVSIHVINDLVSRTYRQGPRASGK